MRQTQIKRKKKKLPEAERLICARPFEPPIQKIQEALVKVGCMEQVPHHHLYGLSEQMAEEMEEEEEGGSRKRHRFGCEKHSLPYTTNAKKPRIFSAISNNESISFFFFFWVCVCVFLGHPKKKEKTSSFGLVFQENVRVFEKPSKGNERRNGKTCFLRFLGFLLFGFLKLQRCEREREKAGFVCVAGFL